MVVVSAAAGGGAPGLGVVRGATALKVSDAVLAAAAGWKQLGVTLMVAGDRIAVAGGPLSQRTKCRLLLCTSRPSLKVAWMTSIPGSPLFE